MTDTKKTRFLIVDDYGTGGIWACVWANSPAEIAERFRDGKVFGPHFPARRAGGRPAGNRIVVFAERPSWMSEEEEAKIAEGLSSDIDNLEASGYFARFLREPN